MRVDESINSAAQADADRALQIFNMLNNTALSAAGAYASKSGDMSLYEKLLAGDSTSELEDLYNKAQQIVSSGGYYSGGGGGGGSFGQRKQEDEEKAYAKFTTMAQASRVTENDKSLQAVADGYLQKDLNSSIEILGAKLVGKVHVDGKDQEELTITVTGRYIYGDIMTKILGEIQEAVGKELPGTNVDVKGNGTR